MIELVDIGVNLTHARFAKDREAVVTRAAAVGVTHMVLTGTSITESQAAAAYAAQNPKMFRSTAGVHPHHASQWDKPALAQLREIAALTAVGAIGETGLDYNRDFSPRPAQRTAFAAQLELAVELGYSVFLHQRDAEDDFLAILNDYRAQLPKAVLHCFTGNRAFLERCLEMDLSIGVTGWLCDDRRGQALRECVPAIPVAQLMIETDAPFLIPKDYPEKSKASRNEPAYLPHILQHVSALRDESLEMIARITYANSIEFFRF